MSSLPTALDLDLILRMSYHPSWRIDRRMHLLIVGEEARLKVALRWIQRHLDQCRCSHNHLDAFVLGVQQTIRLWNLIFACCSSSRLKMFSQQIHFLQPRYVPPRMEFQQPFQILWTLPQDPNFHDNLKGIHYRWYRRDLVLWDYPSLC